MGKDVHPTPVPGQGFSFLRHARNQCIEGEVYFLDDESQKYYDPYVETCLKAALEYQHEFMRDKMPDGDPAARLLSAFAKNKTVTEAISCSQLWKVAPSNYDTIVQDRPDPPGTDTNNMADVWRSFEGPPLRSNRTAPDKYAQAPRPFGDFYKVAPPSTWEGSTTIYASFAIVPESVTYDASGAEVAKDLPMSERIAYAVRFTSAKRGKHVYNDENRQEFCVHVQVGEWISGCFVPWPAKPDVPVVLRVEDLRHALFDYKKWPKTDPDSQGEDGGEEEAVFGLREPQVCHAYTFETVNGMTCVRRCRQKKGGEEYVDWVPVANFE